MSDAETGTGGSDQEQEEAVEFRCRKCPGKTFTAAEKDAHRMHHRLEKRKKKPGPKSRRPRSPSPAASEVTLFVPVGNDEEDEDGDESPAKRLRRGDRRSPRQAQPPQAQATTGKRKSKKNYNDAVMGTWTNGNGA